jgi:hypothetical protein
LLAKRHRERAIVLDLTPSLRDALGGRGVLPEVRLRGLCLEIGQFTREAIFVKVPS